MALHGPGRAALLLVALLPRPEAVDISGTRVIRREQHTVSVSADGEVSAKTPSPAPTDAPPDGETKHPAGDSDDADDSDDAEFWRADVPAPTGDWRDAPSPSDAPPDSQPRHPAAHKAASALERGQDAGRRLAEAGAAALDALDEAYDHQSKLDNAISVATGSIWGEFVDAIGQGMPAEYWELRPESAASLLTEKLNLTASPGVRRKFYDLGSGNGKVAALAWLLGFDATGVELATARVHEACKHVERLPKKPLAGPGGNVLRLFRDDVTNFDFSDADVVYSENRLMKGHIMNGQAHTARRLRPGALVVSALGFPDPSLEDVATFNLGTTFDDGEGQPFRVQRATGKFAPVGAAANAAALLERQGQAECEIHG